MEHRISVSVKGACDITGLSKSSIYRLFDDGRLTRRKLGGKTLILVSELQQLIEESLVKAA